MLEEINLIDIGEYLLEEGLVDNQPVIDVGLLDHLAQLQRLDAPHLAEDEVRVVGHERATQHRHSQTRHLTFLQEGLDDIVRRVQTDETCVGEMGESGARRGDLNEIVVDRVLTREADIVGHQREARQAYLLRKRFGSFGDSQSLDRLQT